MSIVRAVFVTVIGLSTVLVGAQSLFAGTDAPGLVRRQVRILDAGCEGSPESEVVAAADDGDDDATRDHDWLACRSPQATRWPTVRRANCGLPSGTSGPVRCRTTNIIRGPPARG